MMWSFGNDIFGAKNNNGFVFVHLWYVLRYEIFDENAPLQMIILYRAWENRQKNVLVMYLGMMQLLTQKSIHHRFKYIFQNTTFVLGLGMLRQKKRWNPRCPSRNV